MLSSFFSNQFVGALVTLCSLMATWLVYRTNRWLGKHLELERLRFDRQMRAANEREFRRQNETVRTLSEAYARGEPPTLDDLLSNAERDWSLTSSPTPSGQSRSHESLETYVDTEPTEPVPTDLTREMHTRPIERSNPPSNETRPTPPPRRSR